MGDYIPLGEKSIGGRSGASLELCLDRPGELGALVFLQDEVDAKGVDVLGVEQEAIHIEEACPNGREAGSKREC